jgi:hypothetical protein
LNWLIRLSPHYGFVHGHFQHENCNKLQHGNNEWAYRLPPVVLKNAYRGIDGLYDARENTQDEHSGR